MQNKKILTLLGVLVLLATVVGLSYSYFEAQGGETVITDVQVLTHTVDNLTFSVDENIEISATQQNFASGLGNRNGEATATAILTPNSKTGAATRYYYLYLNLTSNGTVYSAANTNRDPELMLQVFDENDDLVTLTGLGSQKTVGSLTGYDITGKTGLMELLSNHEISASNGAMISQDWRIVITLVNLDVNQNDNTDKHIRGSLIIREDELTYCEAYPDEAMCEIVNLSSNTTTLTDGYIYHHDSTLNYSANDGSFRYAGANPNNYICFGSSNSTCPADNIYRIIGLIPVVVVIDDSDPNNIITGRQMLYKIIKNDYETSTSLGITSGGNAPKTNYYHGPTGNQPSGDIEGFVWWVKNTWSYSSLNTTGLNSNVYESFTSEWREKIANVMWKVGGNDFIHTVTTANQAYSYEIINPSVTDTLDGKTEINNKIGLVYSSDYIYTTPASSWYGNHFGYENSWLNRGVAEWTITRDSHENDHAYKISEEGSIASDMSQYSRAVRRVFYLTKDTEIDMTYHTGTLADPYRILNAVDPF